MIDYFISCKDVFRLKCLKILAKLMTPRESTENNFNSSDQGIPGVYGLLLLDVVSHWGYNDETLFAPFHFNQ